MTRVVRVGVEPAYEVCIGAGVFERAKELAEPRDVLVRDSGLPDHLGFLGVRVGVALPPGEEAKDWDGLDLVLSSMAHQACDRSTTMFVVGGGAALDVGGLAAALYLRGIDVVYCPTTLLAMVDASVGGKTAINLAEGKNLVGVVRQPRAVFADVEMLATLSDDEYRSGLGEALKSALIGGEAHLAKLERDAAALNDRDPRALEELIARCVRLKARIVAADPFEKRRRKVLNLGHTFAHAIEHVAGYGRIPHGLAVSVGLSLALELSRKTHRLTDPRLGTRLRHLQRRFELPSSLDELRSTHRVKLPGPRLMDAMRHDKKAQRSTPRFVLLRCAGKLDLDAVCDSEIVTRVLGR